MRHVYLAIFLYSIALVSMSTPVQAQTFNLGDYVGGVCQAMARAQYDNALPVFPNGADGEEVFPCESWYEEYENLPIHMDGDQVGDINVKIEFARFDAFDDMGLYQRYLLVQMKPIGDMIYRGYPWKTGHVDKDGKIWGAKYKKMKFKDMINNVSRLFCFYHEKYTIGQPEIVTTYVKSIKLYESMCPDPGYKIWKDYGSGDARLRLEDYAPQAANNGNYEQRTSSFTFGGFTGGSLAGPSMSAMATTGVSSSMRYDSNRTQTDHTSTDDLNFYRNMFRGTNEYASYIYLDKLDALRRTGSDLPTDWTKTMNNGALTTWGLWKLSTDDGGLQNVTAAVLHSWFTVSKMEKAKWEAVGDGKKSLYENQGGHLTPIHSINKIDWNQWSSQM